MCNKTNLKPPPRIVGRDFSDDEIIEAKKNKRLLRINIEIAGDKCPLKCIYCYSNAGNPFPNSMGPNDIKKLITQAIKELNVKSIILTGGGEPLCTDYWKDIIEHIKRESPQNEVVGILIFTNGYEITKERAEWLWEHRVSVITKLNSINKPEITNELCGGEREDAHYKMRKAIDLLLKAGYENQPKNKPMLGVESVITKRNLEEIEDLWHFIRGLHLYPYIELTKLVGRANRAYFREKYAIGQKEACQLFKKIARIDREKYKYSWDPLPPILADRCAVYYYSCYVDIQGFVQPCAGVGKHLTNGKVLVKENGSSYRVRLGEVVNSGEFETKVRSVNELPMGKCKKCSLHQEDLNKRKLGCYGCRAQPNICWISDKDAKLIARQRVLYGRH